MTSSHMGESKKMNIGSDPTDLDFGPAGITDVSFYRVERSFGIMDLSTISMERSSEIIDPYLILVGTFIYFQM